MRATRGVLLKNADSDTQTVYIRKRDVRVELRKPNALRAITSRILDFSTALTTRKRVPTVIVASLEKPESASVTVMTSASKTTTRAMKKTTSGDVISKAQVNITRQMSVPVRPIVASLLTPISGVPVDGIW